MLSQYPLWTIARYRCDFGRALGQDMVNLAGPTSADSKAHSCEYVTEVKKRH